MSKPTIIVNLKHYKVSSGIDAEKFLMKFISFDDSYDVRLIFAVNPIDIRLAQQFPELEFYAQHFDPVSYGPYTGQVSPDSLIDFGLTGSLLNHSEKRVQPERIIDSTKMALDCGLEIALCCEDYPEAKRFKEIGATFVAYEPPELIGGNVSVSTANPNVIREVVNNFAGSRTAVLVGAGIKNHEDYSNSIKLGAGGVLISSGIVLSKSPLDALLSLIGTDA